MTSYQEMVARLQASDVRWTQAVDEMRKTTASTNDTLPHLEDDVAFSLMEDVLTPDFVMPDPRGAEKSHVLVGAIALSTSEWHALAEAVVSMLRKHSRA